LKQYALEWTAADAALAGGAGRFGLFLRRNGWKASDALLVQLARQGGKLAFDLLWLRHSPAVHAVLASIVPPHEAEDLIQETAVCAWSGIGTLREGGRFSAWVCSIARHMGRDRISHLATRRSVSLEEIPEPEVPQHNGNAEADAVLACIRSLPSCYSEPLLMKLMLGMTNGEIADRTGMTPGSVRVNIHRGLRRLRDALGPGYAP